jgi:hypothetical protein
LKTPIPGNEAEADAGVAALGPKGEKLSEFALLMVAAKKLGFYFPSAVIEECIHVVVQAPTSDGSKRKRSKSDVEDPSQPPPKLQQLTVADQRRRVIEDPLSHCSPSLFAQDQYRRLDQNRFAFNRPPLLETVPLAILDPIFGSFMEETDTLKPTAADNALVLALQKVMSTVYEDERTYCAEFREIIAKHYPEVQLMAAEIGSTKYTSDGHLGVGPFLAALGEGKGWNNRGDPEVQGVGYYAASVRHWFHKGDYPDRLPCIIMYFVGEYLDQFHYFVTKP